MINPDVLGPRERNGISTPDILRVQVGNGYILNDDILDVDEAQTFAFQSGTIFTNQRLI